MYWHFFLLFSFAKKKKHSLTGVYAFWCISTGCIMYVVITVQLFLLLLFNYFCSAVIVSGHTHCHLKFIHILASFIFDFVPSFFFSLHFFFHFLSVAFFISKKKKSFFCLFRPIRDVFCFPFSQTDLLFNYDQVDFFSFRWTSTIFFFSFQ